MKLSLFTLLLTIVFGLAFVESCEDQGNKKKILYADRKERETKKLQMGY